jgi:pentatricopeptide repeat protein
MQDEIVGTFPLDNVPLIQPMVHYLLEGLIKNHEVDRAILLFRDIRARKIRPRNRTYHLMISLCAQNREPEEAFNILMNYKEVYGESQISERMWWTVLQVCAQENFVLPQPPTKTNDVAAGNVALLAIYPESRERDDSGGIMLASPLCSRPTRRTRSRNIRIRSPFKSRRNIPRTPFSTPHRSLRPSRRHPPSLHRPLHNARIKSYTTSNLHTRIPCLSHKFLHRQSRQSFLCTPRSRPQRR